jgi:hypothetical protein
MGPKLTCFFGLVQFLSHDEWINGNEDAIEDHYLPNSPHEFFSKVKIFKPCCKNIRGIKKKSNFFCRYIQSHKVILCMIGNQQLWIKDHKWSRLIAKIH